MASAHVERVEVRSYTVPTEEPESDGTLTWDSTTAVVVLLHGGGATGLGWSYTDRAAAALISGKLADIVRGRDPDDVPGAWEAMIRGCRNLGRPGIVSAAIAAVDIALWDLKARLTDVPLVTLFGRCRETVPVYGSGGFTSLSDEQLAEQVRCWSAAGCTAMKIKVGESWGARPRRDLARTAEVRSLAGADVELMVDANGGYTVGQACRLSRAYDDMGVIWIEEPVSSDDLAGLATVRSRTRADVAAGEYADSTDYVRRMVTAGAVDCLQIDVTRCAGYTEWLRCAAVAAAHNLQVSGHCAPALHAPVAAAVPNLRHVEWFIDHVRLEAELFTGVPPVRGGHLQLDSTSVGHGMHLAAEAERWRDPAA